MREYKLRKNIDILLKRKNSFKNEHAKFVVNRSRDSFLEKHKLEILNYSNIVLLTIENEENVLVFQ